MTCQQSLQPPIYPPADMDPPTKLSSLVLSSRLYGPRRSCNSQMDETKRKEVKLQHGIWKSIHFVWIRGNICTCNGWKSLAADSGTPQVPSILLVQIVYKCSSTVHALYLVKMWLAPGMEIQYQLLTCKMIPILIFSWLWTFHFLL